MAKRLILTIESATHEWQLPEDSDMDAVRENILGAMTRQSVVVVVVHGPGDGRVTTPLVVNGAMLAAAVVETPDSPVCAPDPGHLGRQTRDATERHAL